MTRHEGRTDSGGHRAGPENTPRLRMKPKARMTGHVDGAWWPHSEDLPSELPDLLAVLSVRLGPIERLMYELSAWGKAPARLATGGRSVRLDGFRRQPANTLQALGVGRERILLMVVPPSTAPDIAHEAMMTAAAPGNASTVGDLLGISDGGQAPPLASYRPAFHRRVRRFRARQSR
ncbi:DUF5994 family protein [Mycobacterium sp.]|uniref:DUF5994 family protein n=1 Tax=Mycobacterium sp. TaxID=1785 RepID=UPI002C83BE90|nr:DUF5994 family protein [Mycobacterium sp.]HTY33468.1 DUF5994 family protein [Mycobacterium sp.]